MARDNWTPPKYFMSIVGVLLDISYALLSARKDDGQNLYSVPLVKLEKMKRRFESGNPGLWGYKGEMNMGKIDELYRE